MALMTLNRSDTALVVAGRSQVTGENGDLFNALWEDTPAAFYNSMRLDYLDKELQIKEWVDDGGEIAGTDEDGNPIQIGGMPSRPRPKGL